MGAFVDHLRDAMTINRRRKALYAQQSDGRSAWLSEALITFERSILPLAHWLDKRGTYWNQRGIPIVAEDFICMTRIPEWDAPIGDCSVMTEPELDALHNDLQKARNRLLELSYKRDFARADALCAALMGELDDMAERNRVHLAMTRHFVESIGFAARNATEYGRASKGQTDRLARDLVGFQALGLLFAVPFDRKAQGLHCDGVGILVNDVPKIPFP